MPESIAFYGIESYSSVRLDAPIRMAVIQSPCRASDQALVYLNGIFSHAMHMPRNDAATLGTSDRARRGGATLDGFMRHGSRGSATGTSQT